MQQCVSPPTARAHQLEHRSHSRRTVAIGRAKQIPRGVHGQLAVRAGVSAEAVNHGEGPVSVGIREFVDGSSTGGASDLRRAIQISGSIAHQAADGPVSVVRVGKIVEDGLCPAASGWRELVDGTVLVRASLDRRAVEIAGSIGREPAVGSCAIVAIEGEDGGFLRYVSLPLGEVQ